MPPSSPTAGNIAVRVQFEDFDLAAEQAALQRGDSAVGAIVSFTGTVRDLADAEAHAALQALELEHYPGMTELAITRIAQEAVARFGLLGVRVVHRVGRLPLGAQIVLVMASSAHRRAAFDGCAFVMDYLKTQAPFWKKEHTDAGARWVDARVEDDAALARWGVAAADNAGIALTAASDGATR